MKVLNVQALRGKNFWSIEVPKLIQLRLDTEFDSVEATAWKKLEDKAKELQISFRSPVTADSQALCLAEYCASLAQKLQRDIGLQCNFIMNKPTRFRGIINTVVEYQYEYTGKLAVRQSVNLMEKIMAGDDLDWQEVLQTLRKESEGEKLSPALEMIIDKAKAMKIPFLLPEDGLPLQLGYGIHGKDVTNGEFIFDSANLPKAIPLIAVTGTNGKTTTTRLIAHILQQSGFTAGFTTSDGIYVGNQMIEKGDTTGPMSAHKLLRNKKVEIAVLETARGGMVRAGLGFGECDIGVITNVQEDHLGIADIETMDDLMRVKSIVYHAVKPGGYAVLNAENAYCVKIAQHNTCEVCWFSLDPQHELIKRNISQGKRAIFVENNCLHWFNGSAVVPIIDIKEMPIGFGGAVPFMIQNAMAAAAACLLFSIPVQQVSHALRSFYPGSDQTPGRLNLFSFKKCRLLIDFAHNPDGFAGIRDFLKNIPDHPKIGIITGTGDRRDEIMHQLGKISAQMFDHILIHQAKFLRGKSRELLIQQLADGILSENPKASWQELPDEVEPLRYALEMAPKGSMIVALSDVLNDPFEKVKEYQKIF